jgi:hypothetical protein
MKTVPPTARWQVPAVQKALFLPLTQLEPEFDDEHNLSLQPSYWHWASDVHA